MKSLLTTIFTTLVVVGLIQPVVYHTAKHFVKKQEILVEKHQLDYLVQKTKIEFKLASMSKDKHDWVRYNQHLKNGYLSMQQWVEKL